MTLFICPNCEEHSQIAKREEGRWKTDVRCPHCGQTFTIDQDLNVIREDKNEDS